MLRCAAVLSLLLAGPALAAPPLGATSDNAAIHHEINAADPKITTPPAPLERLFAAAELAETRLEAAVEPGQVSDLLGLAAAARKVAYQRTGEAIHLCQLLTVAERVQAREGLPPRVKAEASAFADDARADLTAHADVPCMRAEPEVAEPESRAKPEATSRPEVASGPEVSGLETMSRPLTAETSPAARPSLETRRARGLIAGGGVSLALAGFAGVGLIAVRAYRVGAYEDYVGLVAAAGQAGGKTSEQAAQLEASKEIKAATDRATVGLAVSGAALAVLGATLVATGKKRPTPARARLEPFGGLYGAGLGLRGSF